MTFFILKGTIDIFLSNYIIFFKDLNYRKKQSKKSMYYKKEMDYDDRRDVDLIMYTIILYVQEVLFMFR